MRVKNLVWVDKSDEEYSVRQEGRCGDFVYIARAVRPNDMILCAGRYHSDIKSAKDSAQAHFEQRILSSLMDEHDNE